MPDERKHYDGDDPEIPLSPDHHFPERERKEAEQLGDGSSAVDSRREHEPPRARPRAPGESPAPSSGTQPTD